MRRTTVKWLQQVLQIIITTAYTNTIHKYVDLSTEKHGPAFLISVTDKNTPREWWMGRRLLLFSLAARRWELPRRRPTIRDLPHVVYD